MALEGGLYNLVSRFPDLLEIITPLATTQWPVYRWDERQHDGHRYKVRVEDGVMLSVEDSRLNTSTFQWMTAGPFLQMFPGKNSLLALSKLKLEGTNPPTILWIAQLMPDRVGNTIRNARVRKIQAELIELVHQLKQLPDAERSYIQLITHSEVGAIVAKAFPDAYTRFARVTGSVFARDLVRRSLPANDGRKENERRGNLSIIFLSAPISAL